MASKQTPQCPIQSPHQSRPSFPGVPSSAGPSRKSGFPFSVVRSSEPKILSTALVSSPAEGRPIPVDDLTVETRTSALKEISHNYPSRRRHAKSSAANIGARSEPVLVHSHRYTLPGPTIVTSGGDPVAHTSARPVKRGSRHVPARHNLPLTTAATSTKRGFLGKMTQEREQRQVSGGITKLPPIEAFTFKSFTTHGINTSTETNDGGTDINADLDRIAEICAKSRYSLSNQYEVHYAPHGVATAGADSPSLRQVTQDPTLQARVSQDERNTRRQRKRRNGIGRNSAAMRTLETIMSSNRSSDDERTERAAAKSVEQLRGRTIERSSHSGNTSSTNTSRTLSIDREDKGKTVMMAPRWRKSTSLALIDGPGQSGTAGSSTNPKSSSAKLVGEPALPQASKSYLETRTASEQSTKGSRSTPKVTPGHVSTLKCLDLGRRAVPQVDRDTKGIGLFSSSLSSWIVLRSPNLCARSSGWAEGSLRELLRNTDVKNKSLLCEP